MSSRGDSSVGSGKEKKNEESGQGSPELGRIDGPRLEDCKRQPHCEESRFSSRPPYDHSEGPD